MFIIENKSKRRAYVQGTVFDIEKMVVRRVR